MKGYVGMAGSLYCGGKMHCGGNPARQSCRGCIVMVLGNLYSEGGKGGSTYYHAEEGVLDGENIG